MRIRSLTMQNFRGFEDATLDLDRPLTVLFGVNGSGKSSVLTACAFACSEVVLEVVRFEKRLESGRIWHHIADDTDIRRGADKLKLNATLSNGDAVQKVITHYPRRPSPGVDISLVRLHGAAPSLSVYYEADRAVASTQDAFSPRQNSDGTPGEYPSSAAYDALAAGRLKFRSLFQWFKEREDIENELKVAQQNLSLEDPQLAAVRRAVADMLPGFSGLRIQRDPLHMVIRKGETTLAIDQLSDGEKLLLALTADLARRLAMTYPKLDDPLQGEAVVLIDEIELHLHPSWQRRALGALRSTFPNCQFIVTTHSPQVLSEVPNDAVVLVKDFQFTRPGAPTAGRDSNAILAEVMDTPERPVAQMDMIRAISTLLDEGKYAEARTKLDALARDVTERDREVVGLRTMLHFLEDGDAAHQEGP
jgi:predicted ATP-binding protein involved in virulence